MVRYNERERTSPEHIFTTLMKNNEAVLRLQAANSTKGVTFTTSTQTINSDGFIAYASE